MSDTWMLSAEEERGVRVVINVRLSQRFSFSVPSEIDSSSLKGSSSS